MKKKPIVEGTLTDTEGNSHSFTVRDTDTREDLKKMAKFLEATWCTAEDHEQEFLCYPEDGECPCGVYKHHVHCANCGGVSQVG